MHAPEPIRQIWSRFAGVPMETFTKGWWHRQTNGAPRQRTPQEMAAHRAALGTGGNCFDLSYWLLHELDQVGLRGYAVGHHLETEDGHIGVVAVDADGREYLCDLGDQWLQPILITPGDSAYSPDWHTGFFPAADVQLQRAGAELTVRYRRPNGKESRQTYDLTPVSTDSLNRACHFSQAHLTQVLCEALRPYPGTGEVAHWEYSEERSFWSLPTGLVVEEPCDSVEGWTARIAATTGVHPEVIRTGFDVYGRL
jgi:hypothetical protein